MHKLAYKDKEEGWELQKNTLRNPTPVDVLWDHSLFPCYSTLYLFILYYYENDVNYSWFVKLTQKPINIVLLWEVLLLTFNRSKFV